MSSSCDPHHVGLKNRIEYYLEVRIMGKKGYKRNEYNNPFQQAWANPKHAWAQVNGETRRTQNLIILEHQTRKQS
jgi:hypothetical protein